MSLLLALNVSVLSVFHRRVVLVTSAAPTDGELPSRLVNVSIALFCVQGGTEMRIVAIYIFPCA